MTVLASIASQKAPGAPVQPRCPNGHLMLKTAFATVEINTKTSNRFSSRTYHWYCDECSHMGGPV